MKFSITKSHDDALREYRANVRKWMELFSGKLFSESTSLALPSAICSELGRISTIEADISLTANQCPALDEAVSKLKRTLRRNVELAAALGNGAYKCSYDAGRRKLNIGFFDASRFYVLKYDGDEITSAAFLYRTVENSVPYLRVEYHILENGEYRIANKCYANVLDDYVPFIDGDACRECSLDAVEMWKSIPPVEVIKGAKHTFFAPIFMPSSMILQSDQSYPASASVFARAVGLIAEADRQFARLMWEYEGGELAVDASEDMFVRTRRGLQLPAGKERLFRINALTSVEGGDPIKVFAPALRDRSYTDGLDLILSKIEDLCGLSRGTLSTINYTDRTATEIKDSKQRLYCTVCDIQKQIVFCLEDFLRAMWEALRVRGETKGEMPTISVSFNDSVIEDASDERVRDAEEVRSGLMEREEFREKWKVGK